MVKYRRGGKVAAILYMRDLGVTQFRPRSDENRKHVRVPTRSSDLDVERTRDTGRRDANMLPRYG